MSTTRRRASFMAGRTLTLGGLFGAFWPQISITWVLTLIEVGLFTLIPLLIGQAIDGLLVGEQTAFYQLGGALLALTLLGTGRRLYDTRAYGIMRVAFGKALASRTPSLPVSRMNAQLDMSRELVDFLETDAPQSTTALIRVGAAILILATFHPTLALTCVVACLIVLGIYGLAHRRFYQLNTVLNTLMEQQVQVLEKRSLPRLGAHLLGLRKSKVRLSDTEGLIYGLIFTVLLGLVMFNLWFATKEIDITPGQVFAIVTYSWDFVEGSLILPATLQSLSRLSEITARINQTKDEV